MEIYRVQSDPHESFDPYILAGLAVKELNVHNYHAEVSHGKPARISTDKPIEDERLIDFFNRGIGLAHVKR